MRVDLFDFDLPPERIALTPARPRDAARMLHVAGGANFERFADKCERLSAQEARSGSIRKQKALADSTVHELPQLLRAGDMLVVNDTKVIPAQLFATRAARGEGEDVAIDVTLHKHEPSNTDDAICWRAFVRPAKRVRAGDRLVFGENLAADVEAREGAECVLLFRCARGAFDAALAEHGAAPLPPYIARRRAATAQDLADYQTAYAQEEGSVAAPTAGLHFTPALLDELRQAGVQIETITLHVGAGTFLPMSVDDTEDHVMHSEWGEITESQAERINTARAKGGRIVAVGTTSLRLLESAAAADGAIRPFCQETDIFITPGYQFRAVDLLLTNFHLPRSTLFMLVCAFAGVDAMKRAYAHAIDKNYRFYSYGDACLLERDT